MIDKQGESNISTNVTKKAAVLSHMGSRTAACLLMLYSFWVYRKFGGFLFGK